jgi:aspartate kinase
MKIVSKFGGSSVAIYPKKIKEIFNDKKSKRDFVVVSAPGKKDKNDTKLTDILLEFYKLKKVPNKVLEKIAKKFLDLNIDADSKIVFQILKDIFEQKKSLTDLQYKALVLSCGEKISAMFFAKYLKAEFLDSADIFVLDVKGGDNSNGVLNFNETKKKILKNKQLKQKNKRFVIPGFYGKTKDGKIATFSRGGSDLSGAYIAYFLNCSLYENFTDSPVLKSDPRIVKNPKKIDKITYRELWELTYSGFSILHKDVVKPLFEKKIKLEIKSTKKFPEIGTIVQEKRSVKEAVLAVAGKEDFFVFEIFKNGLNSIDFITSEIFKIFRKNNVPIEHFVSGIDEVSIIVESVFEKRFKKIKSEIEKKLEDKNCVKVCKTALICVSGQGMKKNTGILSEITKTLSKNKINIKAVLQSFSELNIIFFVETKDLKKSIRAVYKNFIF